MNEVSGRSLRDGLSQAEPEVSALRASIPSAWQPIETAPQDGTMFVTFTPDSDEPFDFAYWAQDDWRKMCCGFRYVTHWMSLPEPPR